MSTNLLAVINRAYYVHVKKTGVSPTVIYVGHKEAAALRQSHDLFATLHGDVGVMEVMGLRVFEVCADNHFHVC